MEALQTLVMTLPLSLTAGLNLYATVLVVGLAVRYGWVQNAPQSLDVLGSLPVLIVAGVMYAIEFVVDKFQFFDNAWDLIHTFIRPLGAIAIAAILAYGEGDPAVTVIAALLLAGSVSFVSHTAKAGTRAVVNVISPYENFTNIGLSVTEDLVAGGLAALALGHPYLAAGVTVVILAFIVFFLPRLWRWGGFVFTAVLSRVLALGRQRREPDLPPAEHLALLGHRPPTFSAWVKAQKIPWCAGRSGWLCVIDNRLFFGYRKWLFLHRSWQVALDQVQAVYFRRSWLTDKVEVHYLDARSKARVARFLFTRYRSPLAEDLGRRLNAHGVPGAAAEGKVLEGELPPQPA
jgi:hypothetical protein